MTSRALRLWKTLCHDEAARSAWSRIHFHIRQCLAHVIANGSLRRLTNRAAFRVICRSDPERRWLTRFQGFFWSRLVPFGRVTLSERQMLLALTCSKWSSFSFSVEAVWGLDQLRTKGKLFGLCQRFSHLWNARLARLLLLMMSVKSPRKRSEVKEECSAL